MNAIVNFVITIPITNIHPFEDNPYKVQDNEGNAVPVREHSGEWGSVAIACSENRQQRNMRLFLCHRRLKPQHNNFIAAPNSRQ